MRDWLQRDWTPHWVDMQMRPWLDAVAGDLPRDEWLVGDAVPQAAANGSNGEDGNNGESGPPREYVVHLTAPRFIARVVALTEDGEASELESPVDLFGGPSHRGDGYVLAEVV